jgi:uncharacterized phage protein (TIGR01671 family)
MREILFKAKRIDNGEWVVGQYVNTCYPGNDKETGHFIAVYPNEYHEIYTSTICQFTGLCDKNGNKIWENDILRFTQQDETKIDVIKYNAPIFTYFGLMRWSLYKDEVIGNIFDNPELLQEESNE